MTLLYIKRYTDAFADAHPDWLFVFGDNLLRVGRRGQAEVMRDRFNAIGIATKRAPSMEESAFFTEEDYDDWFGIEKPKMQMLMLASRRGRTIIWPLDGIGTGFAQLEKRAPSIWAEIERLRAAIE